MNLAVFVVGNLHGASYFLLHKSWANQTSWQKKENGRKWDEWGLGIGIQGPGVADLNASGGGIEGMDVLCSLSATIWGAFRRGFYNSAQKRSQWYVPVGKEAALGSCHLSAQSLSSAINVCLSYQRPCSNLPGSNMHHKIKSYPMDK